VAGVAHLIALMLHIVFAFTRLVAVVITLAMAFLTHDFTPYVFCGGPHCKALRAPQEHYSLFQGTFGARGND